MMRDDLQSNLKSQGVEQRYSKEVEKIHQLRKLNRHYEAKERQRIKLQYLCKGNKKLQH